MTFAVEKHPQILHRWRRATVIKVDKVRGVIAPQDITDMTVTMDANEILGLNLAEDRPDLLL